MADVNFNYSAAGNQALTQAVGPILAGLMSGAPDCWPKINHAVHAIVAAANRNLTLAWNTVAARDNLIHSIQGQQASQNAQLQQVKSQLTASQRETALLRTQLTTANNQVNQLKSSNLTWQRAATEYRNQSVQWYKAYASAYNGVRSCVDKLAQCQVATDSECRQQLSKYTNCV